MTQLSGGCLCGQSRFTYDGDIQVAANCHCTDCQKVSGTGHITNVGVLRSGLSMTGPISSHSIAADSGNINTRSFCSQCGSPLLQDSSGSPDIVFLHAGTFDDPNVVSPTVAVFVRSAPKWDSLAEGIYPFETMPPK